VAVCFHRCDFFYLYITIGFRLLDTYQACGEQRGCSPFVGKIQAAGLEIFPSKSIRISPAPHVSHWQASKNRC